MTSYSSVATDVAAEFVQFVADKVGPTAAAKAATMPATRASFVRLYTTSYMDTLVEGDYQSVERAANRANKMWDKFQKEHQANA